MRKCGRKRGRLAIAMVGGLVVIAGCADPQKGWPDRSQGRLGLVHWCDAKSLPDRDPYAHYEDSFEEQLAQCARFPDYVAVSSDFRPRFLLSQELPDEVESGDIEFASPEFVERDGVDWVALREGEVGMLAMGSGMVLDYKMLRVLAVDWIAIDGPNLPPLNEEIELTSRPMGGGEFLHGDMTWEWRSLSEGLEITDSHNGNATIIVTTPEPVTFEVSVGGFTLPITFEAYAGPMRQPANPNGGGGDDGDDGYDPPGGPAPGGIDNRPPPGGGQ